MICCNVSESNLVCGKLPNLSLMRNLFIWFIRSSIFHSDAVAVFFFSFCAVCHFLVAVHLAVILSLMKKLLAMAAWWLYWWCKAIESERDRMERMKKKKKRHFQLLSMTVFFNAFFDSAFVVMMRFVRWILDEFGKCDVPMYLHDWISKCAGSVWFDMIV